MKLKYLLEKEGDNITNMVSALDMMDDICYLNLNKHIRCVNLVLPQFVVDKEKVKDFMNLCKKYEFSITHTHILEDK